MTQRSVRPAVLALLAAAALLMSAAPARADGHERVIRIYDTTGIASDIRREAMQTAASILADAGIPVEWRDCTENSDAPLCQHPRRRRDLIVRIMPAIAPGTTFRGRSLELRTAQGGTNLPLGVAVINPVTLTGEMATIFHEQVRSVARRSGVDDAELLGRAFAHEVGHLLLRTRRHSDTGLMRGVWSVEELTLNRRDDWLFAPADRRRLQQNLARPLVGDDASVLDGRDDLQ